MWLAVRRHALSSRQKHHTSSQYTMRLNGQLLTRKLVDVLTPTALRGDLSSSVVYGPIIKLEFHGSSFLVASS